MCPSLPAHPPLSPAKDALGHVLAMSLAMLSRAGIALLSLQEREGWEEVVRAGKIWGTYKIGTEAEMSLLFMGKLFRCRDPQLIDQG